MWFRLILSEKDSIIFTRVIFLIQKSNLMDLPKYISRICFNSLSIFNFTYSKISFRIWRRWTTSTSLDRWRNRGAGTFRASFGAKSLGGLIWTSQNVSSVFTRKSNWSITIPAIRLPQHSTILSPADRSVQENQTRLSTFVASWPAIVAGVFLLRCHQESELWQDDRQSYMRADSLGQECRGAGQVG